MIDFNQYMTPSYIIDENKLISNLKILASIKERTGCHILLAAKAFSMYSVFPLIGKYLDGITASGINEARLGYEEMGKQVHIFSPAYIPQDFDAILHYCDHIVFNSFNQWEMYKDKVGHASKKISCGLRINPEYSEQDHGIYDPCASHSRLGITLEQFQKGQPQGLEGLHFHSLCEQNSDALWRTLQIIDQHYEPYLKKMKWINFGGGHHITKEGYDVETLIKSIRFMQEKYGLDVYLEPGEAVALDAGYLVSSVLDFNVNGVINCILDTSAACHMPDVLEMPYRPRIIGSDLPEVLPYNYLLGGPTCLAGDVIGEYSFNQPLKIGQRIVFEDMAIYTMVKNNTFNGINLPSVYLHKVNGEDVLIREFGYDDFKSRL